MKMQKEHRDIVEGVIRDIESFSSSIHEVMSRLKSQIDGMNAIWDDPQYEKFSDYVDELETQIKADVEELGVAKENLQQKLALYD